MRRNPYVKVLSSILIPVALFVFPPAVLADGADLGLIEASVLHRERAQWVVLDARPYAEWETGHIPDSVSFSWENYTRQDEHGVPYKLWPPKQLAAELGRLGINEKTPLVVYGDADKSWGGEGWTCWVFTWMGHKGPIRLLNGGVQAWFNNKLPYERGTGKKAVKSVQYSFTINPAVDISTDRLKSQSSSMTIIDTRSILERFKGSIPGSIHIPWDHFFSGSGIPLGAGTLKKLLQKKNVDLRKPVVYYCAGGIRSGYAWLVHHLAGMAEAHNYEGGYEEWKRVNR
jgi:thiosulfate/3-mercaptopyruvate sulfurtransferase